MTPVGVDRDNPAYDKPERFEEMTRAARAAAQAARAAGAPPEVVNQSALTAALQIAGLRPPDAWTERGDLD